MGESLIKKLFYANPIYSDMLDYLTELIYIFDTEGNLVFLNKAAQKFDHVNISQVIGCHINDIYSQDYSPSLKALETGQPVVDTDNIYMINGRRFHQVAKSYPIIYKNQMIGVYTIQTDITNMEQIVRDNINLQKNSVKQSAEIKKYGFDSLIGRNDAFLRCVDIAKVAAASDSVVLLSGPTGSGKEMFAKRIHYTSARKNGPYLAINCAAIPETLLESILFGTVKGAFTGATDKQGLFEQAKGGTLFLDEINSMPLDSQAKLLRVLEEKEYRRVGGSKDIETNVRIISSINTAPTEALAKKQLREDLFYRLSVVNIMIPPLHERKEDIPLLTAHFLNIFNAKLGKQAKILAPEVNSFFQKFSWPGNVRQLKHTLESALSLMDDDETVLTARHLPQYLFDENKRAENISAANSSSFHSNEMTVMQSIHENEKQKIIDALIQCNGNVSKAARTLNIHRQSLIYKMKKYNIS